MTNEPMERTEEPAPTEGRPCIISVDDHVVEPSELFERWMPSALRDAAPRVVDVGDGTQAWSYEGELHTWGGTETGMGRPMSEWSPRPLRFDEMREAYWNVDQRVVDMDTGGVYASLCFPSGWCGFAGRVFSASRDPRLGLEVMRAYNRWHLEEWFGSYPKRFIPMQLAWFADPDKGAEEIRQNASRGFRAVSFPDAPEHLGYPSIQERWWDPILRACEETETVVCLHTGGGGFVLTPRKDSHFLTTVMLFQTSALVAAADWVWSSIPLRFPTLKIAMSEGGIGWVSGMLDRLEFMETHAAGAFDSPYKGASITPAEALRRNFWFCTIDDPSAIPVVDTIGVSHIMVEVDYPHCDSTWPDTPSLLTTRFANLTRSDVDAITFRNAAELFRHPLPTGG